MVDTCLTPTKEFKISPIPDMINIETLYDNKKVNVQVPYSGLSVGIGTPKSVRWLKETFAFIYQKQFQTKVLL